MPMVMKLYIHLDGVYHFQRAISCLELPYLLTDSNSIRQMSIFTWERKRVYYKIVFIKKFELISQNVLKITTELEGLDVADTQVWIIYETDQNLKTEVVTLVIRWLTDFRTNSFFPPQI